MPTLRQSAPSRLAALRRRTFRSLRHRDYRRYFVGQLVSFTGSWMQSTALMWLVFDRTADPLWPPLMLSAAVGPTVLLGPVGGSLADRLPKRRLVFVTQLLFLLHAATLTALVAFDVADPWVLFALQLASGAVQAIDLPARLAFVPDLVPRDDLINAVGLNSLLFNAARAVGPGAAGLLFLLAGRLAPGSAAAAGAVACFALNTLSYAAVLRALARIGVNGERPAGRDAGRMADGVRYLRRHPGLAALVALTGVFSVFAWPALTLLPAYTRLVLGREEKAYSVLVSGMGAGALVGALVTAAFGSVGRRGRFLLVGAGCGPVALAGLTLAGSLPAAAACCGLLGFGLILYLSTGQSTLQLRADDAVRGRVMALWAMTLSVSAPAGHLVAGFAARVLPVPDVLGGMAVGVTAATLGLAALVASGGLRK